MRAILRRNERREQLDEDGNKGVFIYVDMKPAGTKAVTLLQLSALLLTLFMTKDEGMWEIQRR